MPKYENSYQMIEGGRNLKQSLEVCLPQEIQTRLAIEIGDRKVGLLQSLNPETHISQLVVKAKQLLELTNTPQVVVYGGSFFIMDSAEKIDGPLASRCMPGPESVQAWANTAISRGDTALFAAANAHLPNPSDIFGEIRADIMHRAIEKAVSEFASVPLVEGSTVASYCAGDTIHRQSHKAGKLTSLTPGGAMVLFSNDPDASPIEVLRSSLFDPNRAFQIAMEIEYQEGPLRN